MSDNGHRTLRTGLEAWENEVAAYWDNLIRSPDFLTRCGDQLNESLRSYQRVSASLRRGFLAAADAEDGTARAFYLLDRLSRQLDALAARLDGLEDRLDDD